ncbi:MAG: class III extradiol ring-cleavage dioxygenase [Candidatus Accumulibacter sp. UW20]|jgi:4,5-DOPA dioxygenase extradiol
MPPFPSLFISHGAPTYAIDPGQAGRQLQALGQELTRPQAILIVSPHWTTSGIAVTTAAAPPTIHDFSGFPPALEELRYPAPGHPALARAAAKLLLAANVWPVIEDESRGLDHGAWVPLLHLFPDADVPVFQVSMPARLDAAAAWRLGSILAPLAGEEVLIIGSGSLTHNLHEFEAGHTPPRAYVNQFVEWVRDTVLRGKRHQLLEILARAPHAMRAHPTPEHFLPLLVAAGAAAPDAPVHVLRGGVVHGMLSMESYLFGDARSGGPQQPD